MELRRAIANKTPGAQCHLKLDYESLITSYLELHGLPEYADEDQKKKMEKEIIGKDNDRYHREDGACWCFKNLGVRAFVGETPYAHRLGIDDYHLYPRMPAKDVWNYVEEGRAVMCTVLCGEEFDELNADEIYAWIPQYDGEKKQFVEKPEMHQVVLIGNGNAGSELEFEQYHPFCNSHGIEFANGGDGCVFFEGLLEFCLVEIKAEPTHITTRLAEISDRPLPRRRAAVPSPQPRPTRPPSDSSLWRPAVPSPQHPPTRPLSDSSWRRPAAPSHQPPLTRPPSDMPWRRIGDPVPGPTPPRPAPNVWLPRPRDPPRRASPPRDRSSINKDRWR